MSSVLAPLLADARVTDVFVNGVEVWVDRGDGLQRVPLRLGSAEDVRRLAQRMAAAAGRRLDEGCPYVDARLPDGSRLHAVLPPVARNGPYLSVRSLRTRAFTLDQLVAARTIDPGGAAVLAAIVEARLPYLIVGGTGAGKTTLLSALLSLVPERERIVIVEEASELNPQHPHVVTLEARLSNVEGAGAVTVRELVRQALRMRPDRLVVGECRGAEVVDLLGALNTGHDGGAATLHANSASEVPARLEALALLAGVPRDALHAQLLSALRIVISVRRDGRRRVVDDVSVVMAGPGRRLVVATAWLAGHGAGPAAGSLAQLLSARAVEPPRGLVANVNRRAS